MKSLFEETGGTYRQVGDYFIPNLVLILSILLYTIFSKKTSFLDHHQYSQSEVNIGGDPVA